MTVISVSVRRIAVWRSIAGGLCIVLAGAPMADVGGQEACPLAASDRADVFKNPFNKNSAHHRPIGGGAVYASDDHSGTRDWLKAALFNINNGNPSGTSMVEVSDSDPFYVIAGAAKCDRVVGMPVTIRLPAGGFLNNATRSDGGCADNVVVVFDTGAANNNGDDTIHQLRQYDWNGARPVAQKRVGWDIRGLGHGTRYGQRIGTAASGVAGMFGVLRGHEINTPGYKITHALQMGLPRKDPNNCNVMLSKEVVLPATFRDSSYNAPNNNTGNIPYGALIAIKTSVDITMLGLSEPGLRLAEALQNYGVYVVNGGGCSAGALDADQHITRSTRSLLSKDIRKIYPHMRQVMNNDVLGDTVAGGGTPRAANCAFDAG